MTVYAIKKAVMKYGEALKRDGLKTQYLIVRAALADLHYNRDEFHLNELIDLLVEMQTATEYNQSEKTLQLLGQAIAEAKKPQ